MHVIWSWVFCDLLAEIPLIGRNTNQSSIDAQGKAERAVDGNTNGHYGGDSCTHTGSCNVSLSAFDHSHTVLIYRRSERVGPFIRICRPDRNENEARNCQQMQMCGTRVWKKFLYSHFLINWHVNEYAVNIPFYKSLLALYNSWRIIILLTSMQFFHRGYVAEFCTVPQCSRSSNKNGDDFDIFSWFLPYLDLNQY